MIEYAIILAAIAAVVLTIQSEIGNRGFSFIQSTSTALDEINDQL